MVDKEIFTINDEIDMNYALADSLKSNVFYSIMLPFNTVVDNFGSRLHEIKKNNQDGRNMAVLYINQCLQWLIDTNRATKIDVTVEENKIVKSRIDILIAVSKSDKKQIVYKLYYDVV
jgi:phage gp46-like protein